jgi:hypothetical protein
MRAIARTFIAPVMLTVALVAGSAAQASPFRIPIDSSSSSLTVELCVDGQILGVQCDDDSSSVSGETWWEIDSVSNPTTLTLHAYTLTLNETINLSVQFGIVGGITATGTGISIEHPNPFTPLPPTPLSMSTFDYLNVPANVNGMVAYNSTGLVCTALQGLGLLCNDTIDLAQQGEQTGSFAGTVMIMPDRTISIEYNPNVSQAIDEDNPDVGMLNITGIITGMVQLPLRGDANLNGTVDGDDVDPFVGTLMDPGGATWESRFATDMNNDNAFNAADAALFVDCLLNDNCPD